MAQIISESTNDVFILKNDTLTVLAGGVVTNAEATSQSRIEVTGGTVNNTTIDSNSWLDVSDGGSANNTTVGYGCEMDVLEGGKVYGAVLNGGYAVINSGGVANDVTVGDGAFLLVASGGTASVIQNNGADAIVEVQTGGVVSEVTADLGSWITIYSGGTALKIRENGGYVDCKDTANVTFVPNEIPMLVVSGGQFASIHPGTTVASTLVTGYNQNGGLLDVFKDAVLSNITVTSSGQIENYGFISSITVLDGGYIYVRANKMEQASILENGYIVIDSSGKGSNVAIYGGGRYLLNGGSAKLTEVSSGGTFTIQNAENSAYNSTYQAVAETTTVLAGGEVRIVSCGSADTTTVKSGGMLKVFSGGTATNLIAEDGACISFDVTANTYVNGTSNGSGFEMKDGEISSFTVESDSVITIDSKGTGRKTTVKSRGSVQVSSGGTLYDTTVYDGGQMYVAGGGKSYNTKINRGGRLGFVVAWGTVIEGTSDGKEINVNDGLLSGYTIENSEITISSGGTAVETTIKTNGALIVISGGKASDTFVSSGGVFEIFDSGSATSATVGKGGNFQIYSGGKANSASVNSEGLLEVFDGGTASRITISKGGSGTITDGTLDVASIKGGHAAVYGSGSAIDISISDGGSLDVADGGTANGVAIGAGGSLNVSYGGNAANATVNSGGSLYVANGGTALQIKEFGGWVTLDDNASATFLANTFSGQALKGNSATVHSGTTAVGTVIHSSAELLVFNGGVAKTTTVKAGGSLTIQNGATADGISVDKDGTLSVSSGGRLTGPLMFGDGANVALDYGADLVWDLTRTTAGAPALVNDLSILQGNVSYTLILGSNLTEGDYRLAENAAGFYETITVKNTGEEEIGYLDVDGTIAFNQWSVTLKQEDSLLLVTVVSGSAAADSVPPTVSDITVNTDDLVTNHTVTVTASFSDETELVSSLFKIGENGKWTEYTGGVTVSKNAVIYFKAVDAAGNESEIVSYEVTEIVTEAPEITLSGDTTTPLQVSILTASTDSDLTIYYSTDQENWTEYAGPIEVTSNGTYYFKATDLAGNTGTNYLVFDNIDNTAPVISLDGDNTTPLTTASLSAETDDGSTIFYRVGDSGQWVEYTGTISVSANAAYTFKATDAAGNVGTADIVFNNIQAAVVGPGNPVGTPEKVSWQTTGAAQYIVDYSTDNFEHVIRVVTTGNAVDMPDLPTGTYQWRVKEGASSDWAVGEAIVSSAGNQGAAPKVVQSNEDGNNDLFFATPYDTWSRIYYAQHVGSVNDWTGTDEVVSAAGKGRIRNLFFGSADPNVLCLTDGDNGDAIFVDDVFTDLPESISEHMSRLYKIQEIRAGAGDDIVDMTSQRFEYTGGGLTVRAGDGDDVIWSSKGDNFLFGDDGNDRIVGASGNDLIAGGAGNDSMHGGGGNDVFAFCENWGTDTVEQLGTGSVTLWFASGSKSNWNANTLTYTDGANSVTVSGVSADRITLKFGDDSSARYTSLSDMGAFDAFTSRKVFEESGSGILASL